MLKSKIIITFSGFLISAVCNFTVLFLLTNNISSTDLGRFFWALALIGLTGISTGIDTTHVKKYSDDFNPDKLAVFLFCKFILSLLPLIVSYLIFTGFILDLKGSQISKVILILGLMNFTQRIYTFFSATYTALGKVAIRESMHMSQSFSKLFGVLCLIYYFGAELTNVSYVYLLSSIVPLIIGYYFFKNDILGSLTLDNLKDYVSFAFPLFLSEGLTSIFQRLDKLIVVYFFSYGLLSVYVVCLSLVNLLKFLNKTLSLTAFPKINSSLNSEDFNQAQSIFSKTNYILLLFVNISLFMVILFSDEILLRVYGTTYSEGSTLFILLYFSFALRLLSITGSWLLLSRDKQYLLSKIEISRILSIITLMLFLLQSKMVDPYLSLGLSWLISNFFYLFLCLKFSSQDKKISIISGFNFKMLFIGISPSVVLICLQSFYDFSFYQYLIVFMSFIFYWLLISYFNLINNKLIFGIFNALNFYKLFGYIKEEVKS